MLIIYDIVVGTKVICLVILILVFLNTSVIPYTPHALDVISTRSFQ